MINYVNKVEFCYCYYCIYVYFLIFKSCKKIIGLLQLFVEKSVFIRVL